MTAQPKSVRQLIHNVVLSKARMEALTDGIFAIAMTLLVLELKVPELPRSVPAHELLRSLAAEKPVFLSFFFSFLYCGLLWFFHHLAMHFFRHLQVALVWLNLLFLMSISLLPFSCALLGHFGENRAVLEIYFGHLFASAMLLWAQWLLASRRNLINEDDPRAAKAMGQQLFIFPAAVGAGLLASAFKPIAGVYAVIAVTLALRIWQRQAFRKELRVIDPSQSAS